MVNKSYRASIDVHEAFKKIADYEGRTQGKMLEIMIALYKKVYNGELISLKEELKNEEG